MLYAAAHVLGMKEEVSFFFFFFLLNNATFEAMETLKKCFFFLGSCHTAHEVML